MIPKYIENWLTIIEQMNNDNTYKLAWGRAIIECICFNKYRVNDEKIIIEFDDISLCMLKYYWNQLFFFKLKQSPYANKAPVICNDTTKLISKYQEIAKSNIPVWFDVGTTLIKNVDNCFFNEIIKHISQVLHENVCWRFKKILGGTMEIYEYQKHESRIIFNKDDAMILKDYSFIISQLLNYRWSQLLEKFNYAPKISLKVNSISQAKIKRNSLIKYKNVLLKQFEDGKIKDFYTGEEINYNDISIDHVIPWSFMYSDDIWNLVITSKSHNSMKSNTLPRESDIEKLRKRNEDLEKSITGKLRDDLLAAKKNNYLEKFYYECKL